MTGGRLALVGFVVALTAVGVVGLRQIGTAETSTVTTVPVSWSRVVRTDVVERQQMPGTLDYSGSFSVADTGDTGVVTWLPTPGVVIRRGQILFAVGGSNVRLLYGSRAASRDLSLGARGADVRELQQNLRALGYTAPLDGRFDVATLAAVEAWQRALHEPVTGKLPLGSIVFQPGAVRIDTLAVATGAPVQSGAVVASGTSAEPAVLVPLDPGGIAQLAIGDPVLVTLPDDTLARGRVGTIGHVATMPSSDNGQNGGGNPTIPVTVTMSDPRAAGGLDQAPVQVAITEQVDRHVLAVPIVALLAQPDGGYAVSVAEGATTRLVSVATGLFDDVAGRVEVSGAGLAPGVRVQVPSR
jgi:peptidoglycan hydrolase-like protein with peptidoglycan-binding domain